MEWKYGGLKLQEMLFNSIKSIWKIEEMQKDWEDANIVPMFKKSDQENWKLFRNIGI